MAKILPEKVSVEVEVPVRVELAWMLDGRELSRDEVLAMYHAMGDWLIGTAPDPRESKG